MIQHLCDLKHLSLLSCDCCPVLECAGSTSYRPIFKYACIFVILVQRQQIYYGLKDTYVRHRKSDI